MNDIGKKAAKANNLRRTQALEVHETSEVLRGIAEARGSQPRLRSVAIQDQGARGLASTVDASASDPDELVRRA